MSSTSTYTSMACSVSDNRRFNQNGRDGLDSVDGSDTRSDSTHLPNRINYDYIKHSFLYGSFT